MKRPTIIDISAQLLSIVVIACILYFCANLTQFILVSLAFGVVCVVISCILDDRAHKPKVKELKALMKDANISILIVPEETYNKAKEQLNKDEDYLTEHWLFNHKDKE